MSRDLTLHAALLYGPLTACLAAVLIRRPRQREVAAATVASGWVLASTTLVDRLAAGLGWWSGQGGPGHPLPPSAVIAWTVAWGALPTLAGSARRPMRTLAAMLTVDALAMPRLAPVVVLGRGWWWGEALSLGVVAAPALLLAELTRRDRHLAWRAAMQCTAVVALLGFCLTDVTLRLTHGSWRALRQHSATTWQLFVLAAAAPTAMSLAALTEFVQVGKGTPVPLDPPRHLVTTGPYAYVANPMQLGATVLFVEWGLLLESWPVSAIAVGAAAFSAGYARSVEDRQLASAFGPAWHHYRQHVHSWLPRWTPWQEPARPAMLYVDDQCATCSATGDALADGATANLTRTAADLAPHPLRRITYRCGDIEAFGVRAVGRALEHRNLAWALAGWILRLPVLHLLWQWLADASGSDPQRLATTKVTTGPRPDVGRSGRALRARRGSRSAPPVRRRS